MMWIHGEPRCYGDDCMMWREAGDMGGVAGGCGLLEAPLIVANELCWARDALEEVIKKFEAGLL